MADAIEVGDIVLDNMQRPLFVVKTYITSLGDEACDCVLADDDEINDDSWQNPMFYRKNDLAKVFFPGRFWTA